MTAQENINVLVVDDQTDNLLFLEAILQSPHYRLIKARSGKEALEYLESGTVAVILLDVQMPGLDGFETATLIKQQGRSRHTPIIFLTAVSLDEDQIFKAYSVGAVDTLPKSINPAILKSKVSVFTDLYKKNRDRWLAVKGRADALAVENAQLDRNTKREREERQETEKRWSAQQKVTRILAEAGSLNDATPKILQTVCESFGWEMGGLWLAYRKVQELRCVATWHPPSVEMSEFKELCRKKTFSRHEGLPGRIWADEEPAWISDVVGDPNFPRVSIAAKEGLHAAFGFPIRRGAEVLGVLEFFSHEVREPDKELLNFMVGIGSQVGQFIERSWAENALRESYTQLRLAVESARAKLWLWDIPGDQLYFISPSAEGAPINDYLGSIVVFLDRVHHEDYQRVRQAFGGALAGEREYEVQFRFNEPDGSSPWYFGRAHITRNAEGEPLRMYGLNIEITEQKRVEEQLRRKTIEAEESNRLKSQFVSNVSHDLKTPLNAIIGYSHLLLDGTYGNVEPEQKVPLESVVRNANDLMNLINDVLDLSKIEAGKLSVHPELLHLSHLLGEVLEGIYLLIDRKPIHVRWDPLPDLPIIESDIGKVKQILTNLLSNAVKYTLKGTISIIERNIPERNGIEIAIRDTGIGIPPEELPKLFDAFHQIETGLTRKQGGVGLGLRIVKDLVGLLKGEIRVESRYGEGSTFTVFLPYSWSVDQRAVPKNGR
jgi:PAS domain S-box-containing protein